VRWIAPAVLAAGCSQIFGLDPPKLIHIDAQYFDRPADASGCTTHAQCGTPGACLPDGTCGTDTNVAWVAENGFDNGGCTRASPCGTITHALTTNKPYIKVAAGSIVDNPAISQSVTILADLGARVVDPNPGACVTVTGSSTVAIHDLQISAGTVGVLVGPMDSPRLALDHVIVDSSSGLGLDIAGGLVTMSRCVVSGNSGGGAVISAAFDIENSMFVANGSPTSTTGGVTLTPSNASVLAFDTIADNLSSSATSPARGINCSTMMAVRDVISANNQVGSNCFVDYSLFDSGNPQGTNRVGAPGFRNTSPSNPAAGDYYRIGAMSAAIDAADPASTLAFDIDDVTRPQGRGYDIGASEYKP
jgi:hypothetical protein